MCPLHGLWTFCPSNPDLPEFLFFPSFLILFLPFLSFFLLSFFSSFSVFHNSEEAKIPIFVDQGRNHLLSVAFPLFFFLF